jgi:uncharacterized protein
VSCHLRSSAAGYRETRGACGSLRCPRQTAAGRSDLSAVGIAFTLLAEGFNLERGPGGRRAAFALMRRAWRQCRASSLRCRDEALIRIGLVVSVFAFASVSGSVVNAAPDTTAAPVTGCAALRGSVTRTICSDPDLARLNREMRGLYRKAQFVGDRRSQTLAHWHWIIERNKTCGRKPGAELKACVAQSLNARMTELRQVLLEQGQALIEKAAVTTQPPSVPTSTNPGCASQGGVVDRAICNDANLGHWEERLGKLYQQALDDASIRTIVADDQKRWISARGESCAGLAPAKAVDCVLGMTKRRVEEFALVINSRDDPQDRVAKVAKILSGQTTPPPGLDADTIDRESDRADQSEVVLADARTCIRKNAGSPAGADASDDKKVQIVSTVCFGDFMKRMSALELGPLAKSSFDMLVHQELTSK